MPTKVEPVECRPPLVGPLGLDHSFRVDEERVLREDEMRSLEREHVAFHAH